MYLPFNSIQLDCLEIELWLICNLWLRCDFVYKGRPVLGSVSELIIGLILIGEVTFLITIGWAICFIVVGFRGSEFLQLKQIAHKRYRLHSGQFAIE